MKSFAEPMPDIVIPSGSQYSDVLDAEHYYSDAVAVTLGTPVGFAEIARFQTSFDGGVTWFEVEDSNGADLTFPAAGKVRTYYSIVILPSFRIALNVVAAAERRIKAHKLFQV